LYSISLDFLRDDPPISKGEEIPKEKVKLAHMPPTMLQRYNDPTRSERQIPHLLALQEDGQAPPT
jgi:hypothetical protein